MSREIVDLALNQDALFGRLRELGAVHHVRLPDGPEAWLVVRYEEARAALADPRLVKDWSAAEAEVGARRTGEAASMNPPFGRHMLASDPPEHTRLRGLVARAFTARRIAELGPSIQQIVDRHVESAIASWRVDLIDAFAYPVPLDVICDLLDLPSLDRARFRTWSAQLVAPERPQESYGESFRELSAYLDRLILEKRAAPGSGMVGAMIRAVDDGDRGLSVSELKASLLLLLVAGHETTVNFIGNTVLALLQHPDQLDLLRSDWSLLPHALDESLRYRSPVATATLRFAVQPVELGGVRIPGAGAPVLVAIGAANRDSAVFDDADRFDIRRGGGAGLAFGHGIHHCLGMALARRETGMAIRALLERCAVEFDGDPAGLTWRPGLLTQGLRSLPVTVTPRP